MTFIYLEYFLSYIMREHILNYMFDSYQASREWLKSMTGYDYDLKDYNKNFGFRHRFKRYLLVPKSHARTLFFYFIVPMIILVIIILS